TGPLSERDENDAGTDRTCGGKPMSRPSFAKQSGAEKRADEDARFAQRRNSAYRRDGKGSEKEDVGQRAEQRSADCHAFVLSPHLSREWKIAQRSGSDEHADQRCRSPFENDRIHCQRSDHELAPHGGNTAEDSNRPIILT